MMGVRLVDGSELGCRKMMNKLEIWLAGWGAGGLQEKYVIVLFSQVSVYFFPLFCPTPCERKGFILYFGGGDLASFLLLL